MSLDGLLRPLACSFYLGLTALALAPVTGPAQAQQYGAPVNYGEPYAPPSGLGKRRAFDDTPRRRSHDEHGEQPGIWQGLYLGGNVGYVIGSATPAGSYDNVDFSGAGYGLHGGYNVQRDHWVVGLEFDGNWSNAQGSRSFTDPATVDARMNWNNSLRLRAGYTFSNVLIYATGGGAFGNFDLSLSTPAVSSSINQTSFGYVVGGGIEMKFARNWSGRVEALHYGFGDKSYGFATGTVPVDLGVTTVRAGLSYHFN